MHVNLVFRDRLVVLIAILLFPSSLLLPVSFLTLKTGSPPLASLFHRISL